NTTNTTDGRIDINGNMEVDGHWTNNATGGGNVFINIGTDGTVSLVGTTQQDVGGSAWTDFESLTLNNAAGARMMVDVNRVNGTLTLTSGALRLNSFTLIENNTAVSSIMRTSGYIVSETTDGNSRLQWNIGAGTGAYVVPFSSTGSVMIPFTFNVTGAGTVLSTGAVTTATYPTTVTNTPWATYPSAVTNMNPDPLYVVDRFYLMNYGGYSANPTADLTISYDPADITGPIAEVNLQAQLWDGSAWASPVGTVNTGSDYVNNISGINASRVWVLSDNTNPLPIELLAFSAACDGDKVNINWSTASETNNDYFSVERSANTVEWDPVANVDGAGNSNTWLYYSAVDNSPLDGYSYYRLKQVDFDGAFSYSDAVQVGCENEEAFNLISVRPGQQDDELVLIFTAEEGEQYNISLFDDRGRLIKNLTGKSVSGYNEVHIIVNDISAGIYMLTLQSNNKFFGQKILLK
ncbi:MAG: T9SS type A sorting domain-containing protein, partial [Bacteroidota bacterium]